MNCPKNGLHRNAVRLHSSPRLMEEQFPWPLLGQLHRSTRVLDIHFLSAPPDSGWVRGITPLHGVLAAHRAANDNREFAHDSDFPLSLVFNYSKPRYAEPWYFGVCHGMAFAQKFKREDQIRFSQSPSGGAKNPAWDFQYFIADPAGGRRYEFTMCTLYIPLPAGKSVEDSRPALREAVDSIASGK